MFSSCVIITNYLILLFALSCFAKDLPSYFPTCYRDDPKLNGCLLGAFKEMKEYARYGIQEIELTPLNKIVTSVKLKQTSPLAKYTVAASDYVIEGLDNYDIKDVRYNPTTMTLRSRLDLDFLSISTHCNINGEIASIPLKGSGFVSGKIGPINATFIIKGKLRQSRGVDYYDTKDVNVNLIIGDGSYHIENLFDNNEQLNNLTNRMLKTNSKLVTKAVTPAVEILAEAGIRTFMERLTRQIPYNKILPLTPITLIYN